MSWLEIEDLSISSGPGTAGAEYFTATEPAGKDYIVRFRNIKIFSIHFFGTDFEVCRDSLCNRMSRCCCIHTFIIIVAPLQRTAGAKQQAQRFAQVCRVQSDKSHAAKHTLVYFFGKFIRNSIVCHMSPPDQNIGGIQQFVRQAVVRHIQSNQSYLIV